jgi:Fe2+ transport system protein FeoA
VQQAKELGMGIVAAVMALVKLPRGGRGWVADVRPSRVASDGLPVRLRELGFLDGEEVQVLMRGIGNGPIAVRVAGTTFALRAAEAECVLVHRSPA